MSKVCEKFDGAKEFIRDKTEEISNEKLSMEEVTYLFINHCDNFY